MLHVKLLCLLLLISSASAFDGIARPTIQNDDSSLAVARHGGRSLLSSREPDTPLVEPNTEFIVDRDGTVSLIQEPGRVIWSFASGSPIYSSYQASTHVDNDKENPEESGSFFLDYWDDWTLCLGHNGFVKLKQNLTLNFEDFLKATPLVSEDEVILGSKTSTVFLINGRTGRLLHVYKSVDSLSNDLSNFKGLVKPRFENTDELPLHITRTDYKLQSFDSDSKKLSWNLTVAFFKAALPCEAKLNLGHKLGPEANNDFYLPLRCGSEIEIRRLNKSELSSNMLSESPSNLLLPLQPLIGNQHERGMLPAAVPDHMNPSESIVDKSSDFHQSINSRASLSRPPLKTKGSRILHLKGLSKLYIFVSHMPFEKFAVRPFSLFIVVIFGAIVYSLALVVKEQFILRAQPNGSTMKLAPSKKKKTRKSGKNIGSIEKNDERIPSRYADLFEFSDDDKMLVGLNSKFCNDIDGRRIGKLFVSNKEIAKGSNGTIVLEGIYEGRSVAVKRLVRSHHDVALKEIQNLIASDQHPNIVRWYGVEHDQDFVYLSLERCTCSLDDLIRISDSSRKEAFGRNQVTKAMNECITRLDSVKGIVHDLDLWKACRRPSAPLLALMRDMVSGLAHLHELGIIHRDLKPQNVLIIKGKSICAKLSDMGISKRLIGDMSSLGYLATGSGSSGWQAPEQLLHGRQTRAVDIFGLGCVLFFCITGGRHPFGDHLERDVNIVKNKMDLFLLEHIPEAMDLISRLLYPDPELRPNAFEVLHHPLFWSPEMRLSFLRDTSDRIELEHRDSNSDLVKALESIASTALDGKWDEKLDYAFIADIGRFRRYKFDNVRDLLRVMRNKLNHYSELPKSIQELVGPVPEGFDGYFTRRFPKLLIEVYKIICEHCKEEECFQKYLWAIQSTYCCK